MLAELLETETQTTVSFGVSGAAEAPEDKLSRNSCHTLGPLRQRSRKNSPGGTASDANSWNDFGLVTCCGQSETATENLLSQPRAAQVTEEELETLPGEGSQAGEEETVTECVEAGHAGKEEPEHLPEGTAEALEQATLSKWNCFRRSCSQVTSRLSWKGFGKVASSGQSETATEELQGKAKLSGWKRFRLASSRISPRLSRIGCSKVAPM
ncbi:uncharacterized protein LOC136712599 [Amia ocellicauda]|uniref:uncharacterized protein LOC136712599 n=1 Tax=Amia ocellicauda TaxID=2972642 RepID=UPI00346455F9